MGQEKVGVVIVCLCGEKLEIELIFRMYGSIRCDKCGRYWLVECIEPYIKDGKI